MTTKNTEVVSHTSFINKLTWKRSEINRFQSEKFVLIGKFNDERYKLFQIIFHKDGSVFITFPYLDKTEGILSLVALSEISPKTTVTLETVGKVTTNRVKFSYHRNGNAHFSQDGKILTSIKKTSMPITEYDGHLFTFHAQGINHFESDKKKENISSTVKRADLSFEFKPDPPRAIKIVGRLHKMERFLERSKGSSFGPIVRSESPEGKVRQMFLLTSPEPSPLHDFVLTLTCEEIPTMEEKQDSLLLFIGGFGKPKNLPLYQRATFLCAMYPVEDFEEMAKRIESVDLVA